MSQMPSADVRSNLDPVPAVPQLSRRTVLIGAAAAAALGATTAACGAKEPPKLDELIGQLDLARRDSQMAAAAATAAGPFDGPLLGLVADERKMHANALSVELARMAGTTTTSSTSAAPTSSGSAQPPPSRTEVITAVRESADSATKLAAELSGYRAGLLGSIAASCAASVAVSLVMKEPAR
jgi:hypothetical protein